MSTNGFKLSRTTIAVGLVLMQYMSLACSATVTLNTKNFMSSNDGGQWNAGTLTYYAPGTYGNLNKKDQVIVDLPEGTSFMPPKKVVSKPFVELTVSYSAKNAPTVTKQELTIKSPLKLFRWDTGKTSYGVFEVRSDTLYYPASQSLKLSNIETVQIVGYTSAKATDKYSGLDYNAIFKAGGSGSFKSEQVISGRDNENPLTIGTMVMVKSKTDAAPIGDVGVPFYLSVSTATASSSVSQVFNGSIENLGVEEAPMRVGVYSFYQAASNSKDAYSGTQKISEIKNVYASQAGIVIAGGHGSQSQTVGKIEKINVKAPDNKYGVIAGVFNHSNATGTLLSSNGQSIGIRDEIVVSGIPNSDPKTAWKLNTNAYNKFPLAAGAANLGGRQTIESLNETDPVKILIGDTGNNKAFGVLVTPYLKVGSTVAANNDYGKTITELKGSFKVVGGDIAVLGHRFIGEDPNTQNNWSKIAGGGVCLKLTSTDFGNRLILGRNANLYVSPKTAASGYTGKFLSSYDSETGLGILDKEAVKHFSLEAGSNEKPYIIEFEQPGAYAFVDGTFKGSAIFELKASMDPEGDGGYAFNVAKNPIVIKNIEPGSSIDFLVNYDSDQGKKVPVAQAPERSTNDFAHLYLQKADNARIVIKEVANHLIIGKDSVQNITKNEKVSLAHYDKVSRIGIQEGVVNEANVSNAGAVTDRTARGTVTINVAEGILLPAQSYVGDFYMENSANVGVVPEAIRDINKDIQKALYSLDGTQQNPLDVKTQSVRKTAARAVRRVQLLAEQDSNENEIGESVDSVLNAFGQTAQAQTTSAGELKKETVTAEDGVPRQPTCEELGTCPGGEENDNAPSGDKPSGDKPATGGNSSDGSHPTDKPPIENGEPSDNVKPTGKVPEPSSKTSTMTALESVGIANYFVWRESIETLFQRMGEVRKLPKLEGMWVRAIAGKNRYTDSGNYLNNKYYGVSLGVDRNIGGEFGWTLGGAIEYVQGNSKLANSGKDKNWLGSLSLYAAKQFQNAGYLDFIFKATRTHNDFTAVSDARRYISKGAYHSFGYQFGIEYGKQFFVNENWFIDPQVQVIYGHINGLRYRTDSGVQARVKAVNSLIGRVGLQAGYKTDKFETFVRADALRDFTAKYKSAYSMGSIKNSGQVDLKDTWGEVAIGASMNLGKNVNGYLQVKRSFASKVKQDYRCDVGMRIVF